MLFRKKLLVFYYLVRMGDWLGWICLAGYIFFIIFELVVGKRSKKEIKA
jgi:hypothetical protein